MFYRARATTAATTPASSQCGSGSVTSNHRAGIAADRYQAEPTCSTILGYRVSGTRFSFVYRERSMAAQRVRLAPVIRKRERFAIKRTDDLLGPMCRKKN
jgi:hypothetical protein